MHTYINILPGNTDVVLLIEPFECTRSLHYNTTRVYTPQCASGSRIASKTFYPVPGYFKFDRRTMRSPTFVMPCLIDAFLGKKDHVRCEMHLSKSSSAQLWFRFRLCVSLCWKCPRHLPSPITSVLWIRCSKSETPVRVCRRGVVSGGVPFSMLGQIEHFRKMRPTRG